MPISNWNIDLSYIRGCLGAIETVFVLTRHVNKCALNLNIFKR